MGCERKREIRRRRARRRKMVILTRRASTATASEKVILAEKIRKLTPGAEVHITRLALEER